MTTSLQFLAEWTLRSAILILTGTLLLRAFRVKDPAVRLPALVAVLCGSLAIPALTATLPQLPLTIRIATPPPAFSTPAATETTPYRQPMNRREDGTPSSLASTQTHTPFDWTRAALIAYAAIAIVMLVRLFIGLAISLRILRQSQPTRQGDIRESTRVPGPVTLGILHPVIVLPIDWRHWNTAKLNAVLAHERSHIRRHDPATQFLSAIHRALLWQNPLAWYLHKRIVDVAEQAGDDAAIAETRDPILYAQILLDFMRRTPSTATLAGIPMARHGQPEKRIDRILDATTFSRGLTRWSVVAILALGTPLAYVVASAHPTKATQSTPAIISAKPTLQPIVVPDATKLLALAQTAKPLAPPPVEQPAPRPKFDAASIRPCDPNSPRPGRGGGGGDSSRFRRDCVTVKSLITDAYVRFADGQSRSPAANLLAHIEGGPHWIDSDEYTINAESTEDFGIPMTAGPMTQTLLEDRFQLKIHRESREVPVYGLTIAKNGSKLHPAKQGPCLAADFEGSPFPFGPIPNDTRQCFIMFTAPRDPNRLSFARNVGMDEFIPFLTVATGRPIVDKTGITEKFDYRLLYSADQLPPLQSPRVPTLPPVDGPPQASDPAAPSLFTVLEKELGLKLEPTRAPQYFLVIDSISRPSEN